MAYNRNKIILYGAVGIILALSILAFIPTRTEIHITPGVSLSTIPDYGIQIIKISEENSQISHLVLNIQSIEAQMPSGEWHIITSNSTQWEIWQQAEKTIQLDQSITGYSRIRLNIALDSMATLDNGQEIQLGVPSLPINVDINDSDNTGTELRLQLSLGTLSNTILPNLQLQISTNKLTAEIIDQ